MTPERKAELRKRFLLGVPDTGEVDEVFDALDEAQQLSKDQLRILSEYARADKIRSFR